MTIEEEIAETRRQIKLTESRQRKHELHRHLWKLERKRRIQKHELETNHDGGSR